MIRNDSNKCTVDADITRKNERYTSQYALRYSHSLITPMVQVDLYMKRDFYLDVYVLLHGCCG